MSTERQGHEPTGAEAIGSAPPPDLGDGLDGSHEHTRRLVSRLIALADRFEAAAPTDRAERERRRRQVALMRSAAEAERRRVAPSPAPAHVSRTTFDGGGGPERRLAGDAGSPAVPDGWVIGVAPAQVETSGAVSLGAHLDERRTVQQAQGILMAQRGCTAAAAFEALLVACQERGMSLVDLAQVVLDAAAEPAPDGASGALDVVAPVSAAEGDRPAEVVVLPPVEIDMATVGLLEDQLRQACALRPARVIVEFGHVVFCDCCVVSALLDAAVNLRNRGGQLVVRHPNRNLQLITRTFNLEEVFGLPTSVSSP